MLTTEAVGPTERFAYWREVICKVFVHLDAEPVGGGGFYGHIDVDDYGEVQISSVTSDGQVVNRILDDDIEDCLVSLQVAGTGRISQAGRTALLGPGDLALYDSTRPYELAFDGPFRQMVIQFPRRYLIDRNLDIASAVARQPAAGGGVGRVAASYLTALRDNDADVPAAHRRQLAEHAVDLLTIALASTAGTAATPTTVQAFNRQRVLDHVAANVDDPGLTVAAVAGALGVSARSLQKLFADDEVGLGERIRRARLTRATAALADPLRSGQTIARIAAECGYADAAHFSRAFKAATGQTPSDYRHQATGAS